jgi:hypothetical protein
VTKRDELVHKPIFLEGADEPLLDRDAAVPANCTEPGTDLVVVAPCEVLLPELAALVGNRTQTGPFSNELTIGGFWTSRYEVHRSNA